MGYEIGLQWAAIVLTIFVLIWGNQGAASGEKKMGIACLMMILLVNVGYLFELMAEEASAAFLSLQIEYGAMTFVGYFLCLFFCYYAKNYAPQWVLIYTFIFDLLFLTIVWSSGWHDLLFKNVQYRMTMIGYELSFAHGELYIFGLLGCFILPLVLSVFMVGSYISRGGTVRMRERMLLICIVLFAVYGLLFVFFIRILPFHYNVAAPLAMLLMDGFMIVFWGKDGFHMEKAAREVAFDTLEEGVIAVDESLDLIGYNSAAKKIFPELEPGLMQHNIKRLRSMPLELFEDYEKKELDLGSRHYEVLRSEVRDTWGEVRGYVLVFDDQTVAYGYIAEIANDRKKAEFAEQEALRALGEAKRANRVKSDFLANVSHEIRTPMNAIVGLSELIIEESRGRKVYDFACDIKNASTNLLAVINDILSLSRLEAGQMELAQEEYSTQQLLEETLHLSKVSASSKGLQLKRDISPKLPCRLIGDPLRVRQMISNFLDFGMKYTERGYVKLTATHKWLDEDQVLLIFEFEDTGSGFDADTAEGLFDQFQKMDGEQEHNLESIGLGIAISKRFVDLMEGTVEVSSQPGKGTRFTVCFPQRVADIRSIEQEPWRKHDLTADIDRAFTVPDYRVLVVDDNKINLKVATGALKPYGFEVDEAKSGAQAIDMVKEKCYDLILMDHMMPEMDGIEATSHIRNECGENGTFPTIIALSANAYNNAREMFLSNGFQDFISKPLEKDELHALLVKWIPKERRQPVEGTKEAADKQERADKAELFMTGVDVNAILSSHTGGVEDYLELLELYYMDGEEKCGLIERLADEADYKNYEIEVHGLKSASANIGAFELSDRAKEQEFAAKEGRYEKITDGVGKLLAEYRFILHEIEGVLKTKGYLKDEEEAASGTELSPEETRERMQEILNDIENFQSKPAAQKTEALLEENIEKSARDCLKDVRNRLKMYDDDSAEDLLRNFLGEPQAT